MRDPKKSPEGFGLDEFIKPRWGAKRKGKYPDEEKLQKKIEMAMFMAGGDVKKNGKGNS